MDTRLPTILVVEDDTAFNQVLVQALKTRGFEAVGACDGESARVAARQYEPEYAVLDLNLGGESGLRLLPDLLHLSPGIRVVVLTGYASIATAVEAIKRGAIQYLTKPAEMDHILRALEADSPNNTLLEAVEAPMSVNRLEWEHIQRVLTENAGNISATARALNMHRRTLQRKLAKRPVKK